MHRIPSLSRPKDVSPLSPKTFIEQALLRVSHEPGQHYNLFAPLHYERNYAYPLLVWLHGPNDDERQLQRVMPLISMRNYVAVGPRGTQKFRDGQPGFHWGTSDSAVSAAENVIHETIAVVRNKFNIAPGRIFVGGYQNGGTMALRIALRNPELFGGAISIVGPFPLGKVPFLTLDRIRRLPLLIANGRDSEQYPLERTCEELRLFHSAGLKVALRQYPCGDELTTQMLRDVDAWLMERVTGQVQTSPPPAISACELN